MNKKNKSIRLIFLVVGLILLFVCLVLTVNQAFEFTPINWGIEYLAGLKTEIVAIAVTGIVGAVLLGAGTPAL